MSGVVAKMESKGYQVLAADSRGGIGMAKNIGSDNRRLMEVVWFDIGTTMKNGDGDTIRRTVKATNVADYSEYMGKGWKPVDPNESLIVPPKEIPIKGITKSSPTVTADSKDSNHNATDLTSLSKKELVVVAKEKGIKVTPSMNKDALISAIDSRG